MTVDWDRIHTLLHEALALEAGAREDFLGALAQTSAAEAAEVRSLLAAHAASTGFLAEPPGLEPASAVSPGDRLGPYRIVGEIGHGGMGVVYRATRDDASFTKDVAIKLIDPGLRSERLLRRFQDERQILAMLEHPHIARLLDGGTAADGSPYLVMEFVEGESLLTYCDARRLGIEARIELFLKVCDAVQFAHQRLVVHRDLKSDNVLVTSEGSPRLLDFGIARLLAADGAAVATLTAPMHRLLTPDYASPEQIRGEAPAVASDVYSLGVILYELLTGARPLRFQTRSPEEILRVTLSVEPSPPSSAARQSPTGEIAQLRGTTPERLRRALAGDLDLITLRALEKDPARRYGSVEQLARDLRRQLRGEAVLARGRSTAYRVSRFVRRNRAAVVTTALVALALVAGLIGTTWQARQASIERDRANRRFDDIRALAHAVMYDIHDAILNLPGSTKARETLVRHSLVYLDRLRAESVGDLGLQRELATAYAKIADVQGRPMFPNLGQSAAALTSYDRSLALLEALSRAWPESTGVSRDLFVTAVRKADLLGTMGRNAEALDLMENTKGRIRAALVHTPGDGLLTGDLGVVCDRLFDMRLAAGDTSGAMAEFREGLEISLPGFRADPGNAPARRAVLIRHAKLAGVQAARGQRDSAQASYAAAERLALDAVQALPNDTEALRDLSVVYGMRGTFLAESGRLDSALAVYDRSMKIAEDLAAADPHNALQQADVAIGHYEIGEMLRGARRHADARAEFVEAGARYARLAEADSANVSHRLMVARSHQRAGDACALLARSAPSAGERARWRAEGADWLTRSLTRYEALARTGALEGEDAAAPETIRRQLAALQRQPASSR
ncbi:MAG: serine/threonine protein kinase [Candidatus Eisenbacteria bacterium]|nr:serine/threonine protein kinase [Candidatus Eisenbacteria bacterium]